MMYVYVNMKNSIILIVAIHLCCSGCKPKDEYFYVDSRILSGFTYPAGSYWVYKNLSSGTYDSLRWYSQVRTMDPISGAAPHVIGETYNTDIYLYENGGTSRTGNWVVQVAANNQSNRVNLSISLYPFKEETFMAYDPIFSDPMVSNVEFLPSIVVNNVTFDSVYHASFVAGNQLTEHVYVNRKIGILKIEQHRSGIDRIIEIERWYVPR